MATLKKVLKYGLMAAAGYTAAEYVSDMLPSALDVAGLPVRKYLTAGAGIWVVDSFL